MKMCSPILNPLMKMYQWAGHCPVIIHRVMRHDATIRFQDRAAIVVGDDYGFRREASLLLSAEGASLVINSTDAGEADKLAAEIRDAGSKAIPASYNVTSMEGGQALVESAVDSFGGVDILISVLGPRHSQPIAQMTEQDWDAVMEGTLKSVFTVTKHACAQMRQQRSGRIVYLLQEPEYGQPGAAAYDTALEAIVGLSRTTALDMERYGVNCNVVIASDAKNAALLAAYLCTDAMARLSGHVFGAIAEEFYLYSKPAVARAIYSAEVFSVEEIASLAPRHLFPGGESR